MDGTEVGMSTMLITLMPFNAGSKKVLWIFENMGNFCECREKSVFYLALGFCVTITILYIIHGTTFYSK
jgi:hypothetical protein